MTEEKVEEKKSEDVQEEKTKEEVVEPKETARKPEEKPIDIVEAATAPDSIEETKPEPIAAPSLGEPEPVPESKPETKEENGELNTDEVATLAIKKEETPKEPEGETPSIFALRTTANREDQVMSFVTSNANRKKLGVTSVIRPHGMRGYIFLEATSRADAEQASYGVPYARGILPNEIQYSEIEHMLEQVKREINIQKNDIAEIISGPFKREKCKITRIDKAKEEIVVELLEAAVPIPITVKIDAVKVIRRDEDS